MTRVHKIKISSATHSTFCRSGRPRSTGPSRAMLSPSVVSMTISPHIRSAPQFRYLSRLSWVVVNGPAYSPNTQLVFPYLPPSIHLHQAVGRMMCLARTVVVDSRMSYEPRFLFQDNSFNVSILFIPTPFPDHKIARTSLLIPTIDHVGKCTHGKPS